MDIPFLSVAITEKPSIIELMDNPIIYEHFSKCWKILFHFSDTGFRFHMLKFPVKNALLAVLSRKGDLIGEYIQVQK